ncbi:MAG TPA: head GIN domain-containing protein [Chryseolinea sp.]|nr:head GIN domain-containing protein [Chryseolinea sp.]
MKNLLFIIGFALVVTFAQAQETQTRNVVSFSGVKVAEGIDVYLKKGDKESVKVEATGVKIENVLTEVSGSYLKVHMRDGNYRGHINVKVYVTYVKIDKLSASSAGSIFSESTISANALEISCSSAGNVEVSIDAQTLNVSASSAGEMELKGKTKSLSADASSAGEIDAYDLEAQNVEAEASSGASIKIFVSESIDAEASSGGSIRYRGNPTKSDTGSSSGGSVKKSN